ncbi:phasin family protein [Chitinivorax tropicus]|uniref:Phasin family protein n=1 Tax=Chitinivorax tropicus TaxID=714531 RepID=A0A840MRU8_9PROT|nr:phasin family protein [Chitinivorax tropicus]MBB5019156.1 phasin family protein [Chitinivorax tropicus]
MFKTPDHFSEFASGQIETFLRLAQLSLESNERISKLNLDTTKQSLEQFASNAKSLTSVKDLQEAVTLRNKLIEAASEQVLSYNRSVYEINSQALSELSKLMEERLTAFNKDLVSAIDKTAKSAPAGADVAVAALKSTVAATAAAVDSMTKAAKQVADFADASVKAATTATVDAVKTATKKASAA